MPRYELVEGTSSKFWEIKKAKGDNYTVRWGRIGSAGQTQLKKLSGPQYQKLVDEKLKKGYAIAGGKAKPAKGTPAAPASAVKARPAASNAKLEEMLYDAIEDEERWLVYADWLQQQGDVRGELITLNLRKKKPAAKKLAEANVDTLWGDAKHLRDDDYFETLTFLPRWKRAKPEPLDIELLHALGKEGLIEEVNLSGLDEDGHVATALHQLLTAPIGRFVRSISIDAANNEHYSGASGQPSGEAAISAIARAKPMALRSLSMSTGGYQRSWMDTGNLGQLWKVTPYLEHVSIDMGNVVLGKQIDLPRLKSLTIKSGGLDRNNLLAIGKAKWPALEQLTLYLGSSNYGGNAKRADVAALLANPSHFPKLTSLAICNSEIQGVVVREVVKSSLLKQLETLDLSKGTLLDEDAVPIVQNLAALKKLKRLDLSENYLTDDFERTLKKALGKAFQGGSRYDAMVQEREDAGGAAWAREETFRYTVVGE
jgi:uncharacterized protein (TIGR02996 family)